MKNALKFLFFFITTIAFSQSKSGIAPKDTANYQLERTIYSQALKYNDLSVAKGAVYKMMSINPSDKSLKDSLLYLYFNGGSYGQCILLCREMLAENASRNNILEIKAVSEQNIGFIKDALESYEKLFAQTKNIFHQYQIAVLQYQLKRFGECAINIEGILKNEKSANEKVNISINQEDNQQVTLKAAAYNIRGVMMLETKREELAKASFEEALKIQPDFVLAKNNLTLTEKKAKPAPTKPLKK